MDCKMCAAEYGSPTECPCDRCVVYRFGQRPPQSAKLTAPPRTAQGSLGVGIYQNNSRDWEDAQWEKYRAENARGGWATAAIIAGCLLLMALLAAPVV